MTNNINGIDVSECSYYNNGGCNNPNEKACNCINNAVCYFKELKRLQEENKELKEKIKRANCPCYDNGDCSCMGEVKKTYKYKQALEEIKNLAELEVTLDKNSKAFYRANIQRILDVINEVLK